MKRGYGSFFVLLVLFAFVFSHPLPTVAFENNAPCICTPGTKGCPTMKPCQVSNCMGICSVPNKCIGIGATCQQGDGTSNMGSAGGAEQVMKMAQDLLSKLMQGGGGGGGGDSGAGATQPTTPAQPTLGDNLINGLDNLSNGSSSIGETLTNITDSLLKTVDATVPRVITIIPTSTEATSTPTVPAGNPTNTNLLTGIQPPASGFGSFTNAAAIVGDVCRSKPWQTAVIMQIFPSKFFDTLCERIGFGDAKPVVKKPIVSNQAPAQLLCPQGARPGDTISLSWLCPNGAHSAGVGFDTKGESRGAIDIKVDATTGEFTLNCAQGGSASCNVAVVRPVVQIVARPDRVPLGTRTKVYWTSAEVLSCEVTGPNFKETGVQGAATTGSILESTQFTITCKTAASTTVSAKAMVNIGN